MFKRRLMALIAIGLVIGCLGVTAIGCSQSKDDEVEQLRAEVERLRTQVDPRMNGETKSTVDKKASAPPPPTTASSPPQITVRAPFTPAKPSTGTLEIVISSVSGRSLGPPGPWLYIDRKLVRKLSEQSTARQITESLTLVPGTYLVEVAVAPQPGTVGTVPEFAFSLTTQTLTITPNGTVSVPFQVRTLAETNYGAYVALWADHEGLTKQWTWQFDRRSAAYSEDLLVNALRTCSSRIRSRRPEKPVVMLDISEKFGGPREVDSDQIRLLVEWLKSSYWTDWPNYSQFPAPADASPEVRRAYEFMATLDDKVRRKKEQISELNSVARELEEATRRQ